jgi:hypothetical protein
VTTPGMSDRRSLLDDRTIEFDGLAIALLASAFACVGALTAWLVGSAAQTFSPPVFMAGALVGAAVTGAWIVGYPRHAAMPAMALVLLIAMIVLPVFFRMDGALLREAAGTPPGHLYVAIGLYVGGLGVAFLSFMVFGFFAPLAGAWLRLRRGERGARSTLALHCALTAMALMLTFFPRVWL